MGVSFTLSSRIIFASHVRRALILWTVLDASLHDTDGVGEDLWEPAFMRMVFM